MINSMLHFEAALAQAQADCGLIPQAAAALITACCHAKFIDIKKLKEAIVLSGNAAIPLVKQLTTVVKNQDKDAAKFVHLGATSQDVIDTAMVLQLQKTFIFLEKNLIFLEKNLTKLSKTHQKTLMIGRTLLQQAKPIAFGYKAALWLEAVRRSRQRLNEIKARVLVIQLGGAVGTVAGMDNKGLEIMHLCAQKLGLQTPSAPWHTQRDTLAEMATTLGILTATLGKIAKDIILLMQTEVAEVFEGAAEGKGGSSTMPHKRNPVTATSIVANAHRVPNLVATMLAAMPQEHERSAGLWHSEWTVLPEIVLLSTGALERSVELIANLEVDKARMLQNLEATQGLIFAENVSLALAPHIGKIDAHQLIENACKKAILEKKHLKDILEKNDIIQQFFNKHDLEKCFDAQYSIGMSLEIMNKILSKN